VRNLLGRQPAEADATSAATATATDEPG
jgi:hypothetical protein